MKRLAAQVKQVSITIFLLSAFVFAKAQQTYTGKVSEALTGRPVPYATVALKKKNTGVNTNELGRYAFDIKEAINDDTLLVSCVGYQTLQRPLAELKATDSLVLQRNEKLLKPVVVKNQWNYQEVGTFKVKPRHFFTSLGNQYQVARRLQAPAAETWLDKVNIVVDNKRGPSMFRIRVYDLDPITGGPGAELTDSAITVQSRAKQETVDVSSFLIYIPQRVFFVAVEWILIPENLHLLKADVRGKGEMERSYYKPYISLSQGQPPLKDEIWGLFYSGQWKAINATGEEGLAISARVRY
jgi:hypothetical protein